ncbi:hypothetical protein EDC94DRAFT_651936 [Helicostylum pulchrum]|nr:hypothetical protein EDC94DRAFT_651936 [Helicostylum pulchrum]
MRLMSLTFSKGTRIPYCLGCYRLDYFGDFPTNKTWLLTGKVPEETIPPPSYKRGNSEAPSKCKNRNEKKGKVHFALPARDDVSRLGMPLTLLHPLKYCRFYLQYFTILKQDDDSKEALARRLKDAQHKINAFLLETKSPNHLKKKWNVEGIDRVQLPQQQDLQYHNMKSFKAGNSEQLSATKTEHAVNLDPCYKKLLNFCGTENGIINVKETDGFGINGLKYHIDWHNQSFGEKETHCITADKKDELANKLKANPSCILIWSQNRRDDIEKSKVSFISSKDGRILRSADKIYNCNPNHNL